jgi:hypothetical protein
MVKFYNNKELSDHLRINIAKWKRWSREFLPPDPLGGLQSGYARQYNLREAFIVALGGHLVSFLKYSIPEARTILSDLGQWLENSNYYALNGKALDESYPPAAAIGWHLVYIRTNIAVKGDSAGFTYALEKIESIETGVQEGGCQRSILVKSELINALSETEEFLLGSDFVKFLNLAVFTKKFRQALSV